MIIVWHRRDLRIEDNPALYHAMERKEKILPIYIYDETVEKMGTSSKWWLKESLKSLKRVYKEKGLTLLILKGKTEDQLSKIIHKSHPIAVSWNLSYEPNLLKLDKKIQKLLALKNIETMMFDEEALCSSEEIFTKQGKVFSVYRAYWNALNKVVKTKKPLPKIQKKFLKDKTIFSSIDPEKLFPPSTIGKKSSLTKYWKPGCEHAMKQLNSFLKSGFAKYAKDRDHPAIEGTSQLSAYIHFGEISIREIWGSIKKKPASVHKTAFLEELAWREFAYYLLYHYPKMGRENWDKKFNKFSWRTNPSFLKRWKEGKTGYPIVDAGMRQLKETGWMHNRVRMIVASFLIKDGLINWKKGAEHFLEELVDADLASNSLGWQWSSGSGPNANPFFRIFHPILQSKKYDPKGQYIKKWVPELQMLPTKWIHTPWEAPLDVLEEAEIILDKSYPKPLIDHNKARDVALKTYKYVD